MTSLRVAAFLLAFSVPALAQGGASAPAIATNDLPTVALKTKAIRVQPTTITVRVGESMALSKLVAVVLDSAGKPLGRLDGFDFSIPPGQPASVVPFKVTGDKAGTTELTIRYPRGPWSRVRKDARPEAKVQVIVKP
jgi:hypothetical protein